MDKSLLRVLEKEGLLQRELEQEVLELLNAYLKKVAHSGHAGMSESEYRREVESLLQEFRKLKKRGSAQQLKGAQGQLLDKGTVPKGKSHVTGANPRTDNLLGNTVADNESTRSTIDKAEQQALNNIRDSELLTSTDKAQSEAAIKALYAARRTNLGSDGATLTRFFDIWNERMNPQKLKELFYKVNIDFANHLKTIRPNLQELRKIEEQMLKGKASDAMQTRAEQLRNMINKQRGPIVVLLRSRFKAYRRKILKDIFHDEALRKDLEAVDIILKERKSGSIDLHVQLKVGTGTKADTLKIPLNVDHSTKGFAEAVDDWLLSGDPAQLNSILEGKNMQLVTAMENQVMLEGLRIKAYRQGWKPVSDALHVSASFTSGAAENIDAAIAKLNRQLSQEERETLDWVKAQLDHF